MESCCFFSQSPLDRAIRFSSAPKCSFGTFRCSAWLIHDFAPSPMRALVFRSAYSASRNARASAAFAASIKAHRAVSSETLMLQVRFAHPPPAHRTSSSSCSGVPVGFFSEKAMLWPFLQNARPSGSLRSPSGGRGKLRSPLAAHHHALRRAGVPVGLLAAPNARPSGSLRSPSGGRGKLRSPLHPSLLPPEMRRQTGGNPPLREKLSFGARHGFPFRSAYPQEAWSFLRTPPRPAAKRAAATRAATPLPPPASSFFLTARSSFRTSRRP